MEKLLENLLEAVENLRHAREEARRAEEFYRRAFADLDNAKNRLIERQAQLDAFITAEGKRQLVERH